VNAERRVSGERCQWTDRSADGLIARLPAATWRIGGIAYAQRSGAVVAIVAEVEIDRRDGC